MGKHYNSLSPLVSYEENEVLQTQLFIFLIDVVVNAIKQFFFAVDVAT